MSRKLRLRSRGLVVGVLVTGVVTGLSARPALAVDTDQVLGPEGMINPTDGYVPPVATVEAKQLGAEQAFQQLAKLTAANALTPIEDPSETDAIASQPPQADAPSYPGAWRLSTVGRIQGGPDWCANAASQNVLSARHIGVAQTTLHALEGTGHSGPQHNQPGTDLNGIPRGLNHYDDFYIADNNVGSAQHVIGRIAYDTYRYHRGLTLSIRTGASLPWWQADRGRYGLSHVIAANGYYSAGGGGAYVYDSDVKNNGFYRIDSEGLYTAMNGNYDGMVW